MAIDLTGFEALNGFAVLALLVLVLLLVQLRRVGSQRREIAALREELAALRPEADRVARLEADLGETRRALETAQRGRTEAEAALQAERRAHEARLEELREMKTELETKFQSLASTALKSNSERFLELVSERFTAHKETAEKDLTARQEAIAGLVKPLDEKLGKFDARIGEIEKARGEAYGAIHQQVRQLAEGQQMLGQETRKLVQALRAPKTRGRWGEMQLRQVFELAGMTEHVDFVTEQGIETDEGPRRPDAIVRIPGGKSIVIDAKTPLAAYLDALEAGTPEAQKQHITRHAAQVREHVRLLASKAYQDAIPETPDFVVMFIPGETFVSAAAEADPGLIEDAFDKRVLIATPTTLMALIKAIAYGWQQEKMAENAAEVQKLAREIYERLGVFAEHLAKTGRSLRQSVENYNRAVGSLEGRVLPSARKFEALGVVGAGAGIAAPQGVDEEPRPLTAQEFAGEEGAQG